MLKRIVLLLALAGACAAPLLAPRDARAMTEEEAEGIVTQLKRMMGLQAAHQYDAAIAIGEGVLRRWEPQLPSDDLLIALIKSPLGEAYRMRTGPGDLARAERLLVSAHGVLASSPLAQPNIVAMTKLSLGLTYVDSGDATRGERYLRESIAIQSRLPKGDAVLLGRTYRQLGSALSKKSDYTGADEAFRRALATLATASDAQSDIASTWESMSVSLRERGEHVKAVDAASKCLDIRTRAFGADHHETADCLHMRGAAEIAAGDYASAERTLRRAMAIYEREGDAGMSMWSACAANLAMSYLARGDHAAAEPILRKAIKQVEQRFGTDSALLGFMFNNLAVILVRKGDYDGAEALFQKAFEAHGRGASAMVNQGMVLAGLANLYADQRKFAQSATFSRRALEMIEKTRGPKSLEAAGAANNLGLALFMSGSSDAEPWFTRARDIYAERTGDRHPNVPLILSNLSLLYEGKKDLDKAFELLSASAELAEKNVGVFLTQGSEAQKSAYASELAWDTDGVVAFHVRSAPKRKDALALAFETLLRRKGLVVDALAQPALRQQMGDEHRGLFDRLDRLRADLARQILSGTASRAGVESTERSIGELESELSEKSAPFRKARPVVSLAAIRAALPPGAALVEIATYTQYLFATHTRSERRYVAYVLPKEGEPSFVELGEAATVDALAKRATAAISKPGDSPRAALRDLDKAVMQPVRALLGAHRFVFVSPEGPLNFIPFGALVDEEDQYLVGRFSFSYLTSGRDLLRQVGPSAASNAPVIVAGPDYDAGDGGDGSAPQIQFTPLPGTREEGVAVHALFPKARLLVGAEATEARVKEVDAPAFLHVATHGFFLGGSGGLAPRTRGLVLSLNAAEPQAPPSPLARAGLGLAGANHPRGGGEDGVLTALEASGLRLNGTRLVVLSACETGLGEASTSEGVYGLRRAFFIAGAESQVSSLWKVDDEASRDLMTAFYRGLKEGGSRGEALRAAQLAVQSRKGYEHPYFWASFILIGDARTMDGKWVAPRQANLPTTPKGKGGCACEGAPARATPFAWLAAAIPVLAWARRARRDRRRNDQSG